MWPILFSTELSILTPLNLTLVVTLSTTTVIKVNGKKGGAGNQLDHPIGIAIDKNGYVYVADSVNNRVQKFTSTGGNAIMTFGSTAPGGLKRPAGVAVDSSFYVYVSDTANHRIVKFNLFGGFVTTWGSQGAGNTQFNGPIGITVAGNYVTIADTGNVSVTVVKVPKTTE